jgi:hypothetical protein
VKSMKEISVYLKTPRAYSAPPRRELESVESVVVMSEEELGEEILKSFREGTDINGMEPLQLEGGATIKTVLLRCAVCELPSTLLSGTRTQPFPWMAEYVGLCFCHECWFFTPFNSRLRQKAGEPEVMLLWREYGKWHSEPAVRESWSMLRWWGIELQRAWNSFKNRARRKEILGDDAEEEKPT